MQTYSKLKGYWDGAFLNDSNAVVLCGRGVRIFDCDSTRFVQTLSKLGNTSVTVSRDSNHLCLVNASSKGNIAVILYQKENGQFIEKSSTEVKGTNADGGEPYFSADGAYVFFCSERKNIWRYSCSTNECVCIYRVSYADQLLSYDLYNDQLLVVLNSSSTAEHKGFDTVSINGKIIGSARYNNSIDRWGSSISGKWLDKDHVFLMHASSFNTPYDVIQMLPSNTRGTIDTDAFVIKKEKTAKGLYELYMSPNRSFFAFVWMDAMSFGRYGIEICESKSLKTMSEYQVDFFKSLAFSDDEKQMFVFSDEYIKIELSR